jgi:hypothetical protein
MKLGIEGLGERRWRIDALILQIITIGHSP